MATMRPLQTPARDLLAEDAGVYKSPLQFCQYTYVILMTDGAADP